jgi:signal transduction histidine kinase
MTAEEGTHAPRATEVFQEQWERNARRTDRVFLWLMLGQWVLAILIALVLSPYAWEGKVRSVHLHVQAAIFLGGLVSSLPCALILVKPGAPVTRHVVACAQMLWSALLIHLTGGRIETHFHVFGSLAFLAFYRDWKVLISATLVVAGDHLVRGILWPESVYGIVSPEWWRFLEHAFWVVFEDAVLALACVRGVGEMWTVADAQAAVEGALADLKHSQERVIRTERLAAVGQLSASVGHELRNPLSAVTNATTYIAQKLDGTPLADEPRVKKFVEIIDRELKACNRIITDLLDFAREKPVALAPCPLRPLVAEALTLVPSSPERKVTIENGVPEGMPVPNLDKDQFRQVIVNLVQNAVEAFPAGREGKVTVRAEGGGTVPWKIQFVDDGVGIAKENLANLFQPLFTTKTKGTGLGLAIVDNIVRRHGATIRVESEVGRGTTFSIEIPPSPAAVPTPEKALAASPVGA